MKSSKVAELIGAQPGDRVAYGYTFDRMTVSIHWSEDNHFERWDWSERGETRVRTMGEDFDSNLFTSSIKRFYKDRTNSVLIDVFEAFGNPLPITPG